MPILSGRSGDAEELRAFVSRTILAEDSRWAMDVVLSARKVDHLTGYVALAMGHHFVRIAYEGAITVQSSNPMVGIPELARLLQPEYETITARARHLTKLLDNTKRSYTGVLTDLSSEMKLHHEALTGNAIRGARWLEKDLGLYYLDRAMIGATTPIAYRLGLNPTQTESISNADLLAVSKEWGRTLVVLGAVALDPSEPTSTLDLSNTHIDCRDRLASRYLSTRFDRQFSPGLKALLLLIEGDLNAARFLLPRTSLGHEGAVFRAHVITAYHSLSAFQQICDACTGSETRGLHTLRALLSDERTQRLLSPGGKKVRNRSVHYEIRDPAIIPDLARPMYGLVEAVYPERTWETFYTDVREVTSRGAELLADWTSP